MDFFKVVSVEEALYMMHERFSDMRVESETCHIGEALGRILSQDIVSAEDVPGFDRSTVDGYAIRSEDSHGASESIPSFLDVKGSVNMGEAADMEVKSGDAAYVPTGGMLPQGADCVIMIEYVEKLDEKTIAVHRPTSHLENVMRRGDDIKSAEVILKKGTRMEPSHIGVLAALGVSRVNVFEKLDFYIISTGDEVIDLDEDMEYGKVRDINGYALEALIRKMGGEVRGRSIVKDDFELLKEEVSKGIDSADIILMSGGSSVGSRDFTSDVINSFEGEGVFVHGISIKPGKPTIVGKASGKTVIGLPGHPVSSIFVFKSIVEEFARRLTGEIRNEEFIQAKMDANVHSSPGKRTYQMVKIGQEGSEITAEPQFGKSGMISLLSRSGGYIVMDENTEGVEKGETVRVYRI